MTAPFTSRDHSLSAPIMAAVESKARVRYLDNDDNIQEGTARHLVKSPTDCAFAFHEDIRALYVRITLRSGMDAFVLVSDLMELVAIGGFATGWDN